MNDVGKIGVFILLLNNVGKALTQCSKTSKLIQQKVKSVLISRLLHQRPPLPINNSSPLHSTRIFPQGGYKLSHPFHMRARNKKWEAGLFRFLQSKMKDINKEEGETEVWMLDTWAVSSDQKHAFHRQCHPNNVCLCDT